MRKSNFGDARACLVDKYIGSDFDTVVHVSENMDAVKTVEGLAQEIKDVGHNVESIKQVADGLNEVKDVSNNMNVVTDVHNNMDAVQVASGNINVITQVGDKLPEVVLVADSMHEISDVHANLDAIQITSNNLNTIIRVDQAIPEIQVVADNIDDINAVVGQINNVSDEQMFKLLRGQGYNVIGSTAKAVTITNSFQMVVHQTKLYKYLGAVPHEVTLTNFNLKDFKEISLDKGVVLPQVFGTDVVELVNGLVIEPTNNQYPKLAAFGAIYELADNSVSYTVKSFAPSVGGDCVITLSDDSLLIAKKVDAASKNYISTSTACLALSVNDMKNGRLANGSFVEIQIGQLWKTLGYYEAGNGGDAEYLIVSGNSGDDVCSHNILNYTAKIVPTDNAIDMKQCGVKYRDGHYINKLKPISDYANINKLNVTVENTHNTRIFFDDIFHLTNTKLLSKSGGFFFSKHGDIDYMPVMIFGNSIEDSYPSYFKSSNVFRIGEALTFSDGSLGEVMFKMGGKVYFKWNPNGKIGAQFPTSGTVRGVTSWAEQAFTQDTIKIQKFGGTTSAGCTNIYIACDKFADKHIKSTGIMINSVRAGRSLGYCENISSEGFHNGLCLVFNWFLTIKGTTEVLYCADGIVMSYENNAMTFDRILTNAGTAYDDIRRYRINMPYSYSNSISQLSIEGAGDGIVAFGGSHGVGIQSVNIEHQKTHVLQIGSGDLAKQFTDKTLDEFERVTTGSISINEFRSYNSKGIKLGSNVRGLAINQMWLDYQYVPPEIEMNWRSVFDSSSCYDCKAISLKGIGSNAFDVAEAFRLQADMAPEKIIYDSSNYIKRNITATMFKSASENRLATKIPLSTRAMRYAIKNISVNSMAGGNHTMTFQVLQKNQAGMVRDITLLAGTYYEDIQFIAPYLTDSFLYVAIINISDATDNHYYFNAEIEELILN